MNFAFSDSLRGPLILKFGEVMAAGKRTKAKVVLGSSQIILNFPLAAAAAAERFDSRHLMLIC